MEKKKKQVCMLCGKASLGSICENCASNVRGEVLNKRKKEQKIRP